MSRVERFKQARRAKKRYAITFVAFIIFMLGGICAADYSINSLMRNDNRIEVVRVEKSEDSRMTIHYLNREFQMDFRYVKRDWGRLQQWFSHSLGKESGQ